MSIKESLHLCNTGQHTLVEIARFGEEEETVVRWCRMCGAIVGDIEVDGRLMEPGGALKMMGPQALKLVQLYYD